MRPLGVVDRPLGLAGPPHRSPSSPPAPDRPASLEFSRIYDTWFNHVAQWIRALGAPQADVEDIAQEVFLVVQRRLSDFDGRNLAGWLYKITKRQVRQNRRRFWHRLFTRRETSPLERIVDRRSSAPLEQLEDKERRALLERLLARMSEKRRVAFVLFEIEGYSGEEIGDILDVPLGTVWTRLHHARKEFFTLLAQHRRTEEEAAP
jgi:RNA polymerase sigma-70 factor (ECF subfamily)